MAEATAAAKKEASPDDVRMTFAEHLEELRWRLIKSVIALAVCFTASMVFYEQLLVFITRPHFWAMKMLGLAPKESLLLNLGYTAPIFATMKMALIVSLFAASPFVGWQIWAFVSAGLYARERRWVRIFAPVSLLLFAGGCAFGYFILVPYGLYGMATMMRMAEVTSSQYALGDYLNLVMTLTVVTGAIFELPLVMCFTTVVGLTTARTWWKWMRLAVVLIFVAAAVLTPSPDVYTQLLMAVPLLLLYLIGMGLCLLIRPTKRA